MWEKGTMLKGQWCPVQTLVHKQSTEFMLLIIGSSLWCIEAEYWINFKDIIALAQEQQPACTAYLVWEVTESLLHASNSHQEMGFLLSSSWYPAMAIKHCKEWLKRPMTSNMNSDGQLKPTWSTMGQDITHHLTPLCPPFPAWSRLGWTIALYVNILCDHVMKRLCLSCIYVPQVIYTYWCLIGTGIDWSIDGYCIIIHLLYWLKLCILYETEQLKPQEVTGRLHIWTE
jgi:hypothetical protein